MRVSAHYFTLHCHWPLPNLDQLPSPEVSTSEGQDGRGKGWDHVIPNTVAQALLVECAFPYPCFSMIDLCRVLQTCSSWSSARFGGAAVILQSTQPAQWLGLLASDCTCLLVCHGTSGNSALSSVWIHALDLCTGLVLHPIYPCLHGLVFNFRPAFEF